MERAGVGQYFISGSMTPSSIGEVSTETTGSTVLRRSEVRYNSGSATNYYIAGWEILLLQWNSGAGTWDPADFSFGFAAWDV